MSLVIKTIGMQQDKLEEQVVDISCNMALLMVNLMNKFIPFWEVVGSNSEIGLDEKPRYNEDPEKESKKILRKRNHVSVPSLLHTLYLKWKQKWTSNPIKVRLILLS
jgi:hypothetical protein